MGREHYVYKFPNNYGASVIRMILRPGFDENRQWELAVLEWDEKGQSSVSYDTPITEDVLPHLAVDDVKSYLGQITNLESRETDPEKSYAFVDSKCPKCNGSGWVQFAPYCRGMKQCDYCRGTGLVGEYREVPRIDLPPENPFGRKLRKFREKRQVSLSELARFLDCSVSHVSEIERCVAKATKDEQIKITEWILTELEDDE